MNRLFGYLTSVIVLGGLAVALAQCSDAECGNGVKEGSESCDNGADNGTMGNGCSATCTLVSIPRAQVELTVQMLFQEGPGYTNASVNDLGVDKVHVVLSGPDAKDETWDSTKLSNIWIGVTPGTYQATVTLIDANGNPLTNAVMSMSGMVAVPGTLNLRVNFRQTDFIKQDYKGTLYVSPNWGAANISCTAANPAVDTESIQLLTMAGTPVTGMTLVGNPGTPTHNLDGTYGACFYKMGLMLFEKVPDLNWGHYQVILRGKTAAGDVAYCKKFDDLFVGPGIQNPTYELIVTPADADMGACP
jgi:cysteine-rich repeat protein